MALGVKHIGLNGSPSGNRSKDNWQDETNADKFGNRDAIAYGYDRAGIEGLAIAAPHEFGDNYYPTVFLGIQEENFGIQNGQTRNKISYDLVDLVLSTGDKK